MAALQELIESQAMADLVGAKSFSGVNAVVPVPLMLRSSSDNFAELPFPNPALIWQASEVYLSCIQNGPQTDAKAIIVPCLPDAPASREQYIESWTTVAGCRKSGYNVVRAESRNPARCMYNCARVRNTFARRRCRHTTISALFRMEK